MQDAPVLDVHGLGRRYGEFDALQGLELTVAAGECVAAIGHNGSGKTTAARLIAVMIGLAEPILLLNEFMAIWPIGSLCAYPSG